MNTSVDVLQKLLKKNFSLVLSGICIMKKEIDLICSDGRTLNAIAVRENVSQIPEAIGTCSYFRDTVHKTYIALPEKEIKNITNEKRVLKEIGIGLISFSENCYDIITEPQRNNPKPAILKSVLNSLKLTEKIRLTSDIYKALSHPSRLEIYLSVSRDGTARLKDVASICGGCYPLLMKHIKVLEESNLIESEHFKKETTLKLKTPPRSIEDIVRISKSKI